MKIIFEDEKGKTLGIEVSNILYYQTLNEILNKMKIQEINNE